MGGWAKLYLEGDLSMKLLEEVRFYAIILSYLSFFGLLFLIKIHIFHIFLFDGHAGVNKLFLGQLGL